MTSGIRFGKKSQGVRFKARGVGGRTLFFWLLLLCGATFAHAEFTLISTQPTNGAENAPAQGPFVLAFNASVLLSSIQMLDTASDSSTIRLTPPNGAGGVPVKWSFVLSDDHTLVITPSVPLEEHVPYQLLVSLKGDYHPLQQDNAAHTALTANKDVPDPIIFHVTDSLAPTAKEFFPTAGASAVPVNSRVGFTATEPLNPSTVHLLLNGAETSPQSDDGLHWIASGSLQPSTFYAVQAHGLDSAGNPLPPTQWSFTTSGDAQPDTDAPFISGSTPASNATGVSQDVQPSVTFSEPLTPGSLSVTFGTCGDPIGSLKAGWSISSDERQLTLHPTTLLSNDAVCYAVKVEAEDWAGNHLIAAGDYLKGFTFTTGDHVSPTLLQKTPPGGSTVNPVTGPDLTLHFSEAMKTAGPLAPILRLEYGGGKPPPLIRTEDAMNLGGGRWRLEGQGWTSPQDVTLHVLASPGDASGNRYEPGGTLFLTLESAFDLAGNPLSPAPTTWTFSLLETRPPVLTDVSPAECALAAADAPAILRFSHPMDVSSLQFEADGDWSPTATELFTSKNKPYSPRRWISNSPAWSNGGTVATLRHVPFEGSPDVAHAHILRILVAPGALPLRLPYLLGDGQSPNRKWLTGQSRFRGDLNADRAVDATDVSLALNAFLMGTEFSPEDQCATNLSPPDGPALDAADLNALFRLFLLSP